ncbi:MAG: DUF1854 domain-containing protein [Armatimonadetes bacterium]|nr:DUF1854 domain-containing protein [Armatimonadota bacterium]MDW8121212.1 DUF1854 domain-containing protein [Armatimonadota bacterium]
MREPLAEEPDIEVRVLPPDQIRFVQLPDQQIVLIWGDRAIAIQKVLRALPISDPWRYLVVYDSDGAEVGVIKDFGELDSKSQEILRRELEARYKTLVIKRVLKVERLSQSGHSRWQVETNEGIHDIVIPGSDHIHTSRYPRIFLRSADSQRYEIPDFEALDIHSRRVARDFL